ncbi:MAG: PspC domain-containing protein [bacterium]|nr:PspC domain-containing protein [bacterium]
MRRKLYRSNKNKSIYGVCGGIGEFFDINATVVRVVFFAFFVICFWIYVVLLQIMPSRPKTL